MIELFYKDDPSSVNGIMWSFQKLIEKLVNHGTLIYSLFCREQNVLLDLSTSIVTIFYYFFREFFKTLSVKLAKILPCLS